MFEDRNDAGEMLSFHLEKYINMLNISKEYIDNEVLEQIKEIKRRLTKYKGNDRFPNVKNRTVIIIDNGIATGFTIQAAIESIKNKMQRKLYWRCQ